MLIHEASIRSHSHTYLRVLEAVVSCSAILNENEFMNTYTSQQDPYDQYEVAVPIEVVGDCMAKVQSSLVTQHFP